MATYRLKRKCYNALTEAAGNTLGGVTEGVGKALDNKVAGVAGGVIGATKLGGMIGTALTGMGVPLGGLIGTGLGYLAGSAATRGLGKGLKTAGQDMQT